MGYRLLVIELGVPLGRQLGTGIKPVRQVEDAAIKQSEKDIQTDDNDIGVHSIERFYEFNESP